MSVDFVNTLNYEHDSATLSFTSDEEIKNTNESIEAFCDKLSDIICHHTFVKQLDNRPYSRHDIEKIIRVCNEQTIFKMRIRKEKPFRGENGLIKSEILSFSMKQSVFLCCTII